MGIYFSSFPEDGKVEVSDSLLLRVEVVRDVLDQLSESGGTQSEELTKLCEIAARLTRTATKNNIGTTVSIFGGQIADFLKQAEDHLLIPTSF